MLKHERSKFLYYIVYMLLICIYFHSLFFYGFLEVSNPLYISSEMSESLEPFVGYVDGASCSTHNLSSTAWVIFAPRGKLVSFQGIFIGQSTKNIAEYTGLIEILSDAI